MKDSTIQTNPGWSTTGIPGATLVTLRPEEEFLHVIPENTSYAYTETSYWRFCVPVSKLMCDIYLWLYPHLNTTNAGVLLFTGKRRSSLASDYVQHFLPMPDHIEHYQIPQAGPEIHVIDLLKAIRIRHRGPQREVSFDILLEGAMPPVAPHNGKHLIQVMRTTGVLHLYGEKIDVDSYFTRDRFWGADRFETPQDLPPITWISGTASGGLAFHLVAFDDPACKPDWLGCYNRPTEGNNLMWGFLQPDGALQSITAVSKLTERAAEGTTPTGFCIVIHTAAAPPPRCMGR